MFGLKKGRNQNIVMLLAVAALIFLLFQMNSKSGYAIVEREYSAFGAAPAAGPTGPCRRLQWLWYGQGYRSRVLPPPPRGCLLGGLWSVCPRGHPQGTELP